MSGPYSMTGGRYDPATDSWVPIVWESAPPEARNGHTIRVDRDSR